MPCFKGGQPHSTGFNVDRWGLWRLQVCGWARMRTARRTDHQRGAGPAGLWASHVLGHQLACGSSVLAIVVLLLGASVLATPYQDCTVATQSQDGSKRIGTERRHRSCILFEGTQNCSILTGTNIQGSHLCDAYSDQGVLQSSWCCEYLLGRRPPLNEGMAVAAWCIISIFGLIALMLLLEPDSVFILWADSILFWCQAPCI